jgi:hypothetical protein
MDLNDKTDKTTKSPLAHDPALAAVRINPSANKIVKQPTKR